MSSAFDSLRRNENPQKLNELISTNGMPVIANMDTSVQQYEFMNHLSSLQAIQICNIVSINGIRGTSRMQ